VKPATIVFLEHELQDQLGIQYMAHAFAAHWSARGHRVLYHRGLETPPPGDLAIAHVDMTVVPEAYRALQSRYPRVVNGAVADISKRHYSTCILGRGDAYDGPVIVKTDANYAGQTEYLIRQLARKTGRPDDIPEAPVMTSYPLYGSSKDVPEIAWNTPGIIVERFVPEHDERGFYVRVWTFFGDRERSSRYLGKKAVLKFADYIEREVVPVPEELREIRARLDFDFGKFDYVRHDGRLHLLDANRTPGGPDKFLETPGVAASMAELAAGIDAFLPR
jgi:hypothetical protein